MARFRVGSPYPDRVVALPLAALAGLVWSGACATPPESSVIGGLPCDNGACAAGFECDIATGTCVAPRALAASGGTSDDGGDGMGATPVGTGGSERGGASGAGGGSGGVVANGGSGTGGAATGGAGASSGGAAGAPDAGPGDSGVSCSDGRRNGAETGLDCGGPTCDACPTNGICEIDLDCASRKCVLGGGGVRACLAPTCADSVLNGAETGPDCGGSTGCPTCGDGMGCKVTADCTNRHCLSGVCAPASCLDTQQSGNESDVDCGGSSCPPCARGRNCSVGADCITGVCRLRTCAFPSCSDGVKNGFESDKDCGGSGTCARCVAGKLCKLGSDCESGSCDRVYSLLVCAP